MGLTYDELRFKIDFQNGLRDIWNIFMDWPLLKLWHKISRKYIIECCWSYSPWADINLVPFRVFSGYVVRTFRSIVLMCYIEKSRAFQKACRFNFITLISWKIKAILCFHIFVLCVLSFPLASERLHGFRRFL